MAALPGYKFQTDQLAAAAGGSANLSGFAAPLASDAARLASFAAAVHGDRFCIAVLPQASLAGLKYPHHWQRLEGKILVNPETIRDLAVISETTIEVEIWNVSGVAQDCLSATVTGPDGVRVGDSIPLPAHLPDTRSAVFPVIVSPDGAPVASNVVRWDFPDYGGDVIFQLINALRLVVFSAPATWADGANETIEYLTNLLPAYGGDEQRIQLRNGPTRGLEFSWLAMNAVDAAAVAAQLTDWQARAYGMPLWTDAGTLTADAAAGSLALPMDTTDLRFLPGGMALLWAGVRNWEAVQIDQVAPGGLTLWSPLLASWPAYATVIPLRYARLADTVEAEEYSPAVAGGRVAFSWRGTDGNV